MPNTMPGTGSGDKAVAMKKYGDAVPHMESVKQERSNLMSDNPVAKDASGGRGSWMSKHSQSKMGGGSPLMKSKKMIEVDGDMVPSYAADGDGPNDLKK